MGDSEEESTPPTTDTDVPATEDAGVSHAVARVQQQTIVIRPRARSALRRVGLFVDGLPGATDLDNNTGEFQEWAAAVLDLGVTDIIIPINHGHEPPFHAKDYLVNDGWRRLKLLAETFTQHRYPDGSPSSPAVHIMAFCGVDEGFIAGCAAALIDACANVPSISSVMLDCEEWWVGGRRYARPRSMRERAASHVRRHLWDGWPTSQRPACGIGVTGLASRPPDELMQFLDYGLPQIYGSRRNAGTTLSQATEKHRDYYRTWLDAASATRPADACRIIIGHTARGLYVDVDRMRMLVEAALEIGGSGSPPLPPPDTLYYWSANHLRGRRNPRRDEIRRLANLARNGGISLANVRP